MEDVVDGFTDREFSVRELTTIIQDVPNLYQLVTSLGVFKDPEPVTTTFVQIERNNWQLNVLPMTERGGPGSKGVTRKRDTRIIEIPNVTHEDSVKAVDVQNLRRFGGQAAMMFEDLVAKKMGELAAKFHITWEWHRMTALQGQLRDSDGSVVFDAFTEFGITQPVMALAEGSPTITTKLRTIKRHIARNLRGETMSGVRCLCSPEFFEVLTNDSEIKTAYNMAMANHNIAIAMNPTLSDRRFSFTHQEITFTEYPGVVSTPNDDGTFTDRRFIASGEAIFFPVGTTNCALQFCAPGDFVEAANMPGQVLYAKEDPDRWNRGRDFLAQSNVLPIWTKPALLVKGTTGSSGTNVTDM